MEMKKNDSAKLTEYPMRLLADSPKSANEREPVWSIKRVCTLNTFAGGVPTTLQNNKENDTERLTAASAQVVIYFVLAGAATVECDVISEQADLDERATGDSIELQTSQRAPQRNTMVRTSPLASNSVANIFEIS